MKQCFSKRLLSLTLCVALLFSVLPTYALALEVGDAAQSDSIEAISDGSLGNDGDDATSDSESGFDIESADEEVGQESSDSADTTTGSSADDVNDDADTDDDLDGESDDEVDTIDDGISVASVAAASGMTIISDKESALAPGITQDVVVAYDSDGNRVQYYTATADLSVDTVAVYASYKNMDPTNYGMSKLTEQVESAEALHEGESYSVVAGMNASYYNMTTGKPTGVFVMSGVDVTTESEGNSYPFFAILNDGTAMIGLKGEYSDYIGEISEAIAIHSMLIQDGEIVDGLDSTTKYPRSTIGITADGQVVIMTADGNQAPTSSGLTLQEQAEVMLSLGCVVAGELDGGGSATYGSKAEGSDSFSIISSPSDGSERSISNGIIFVSTAVADGTFNRATLSVSDEYITPGSSVTISAVGVDYSGGSAEIPEDITYEATLGTVKDGVFTSDGATGDATISMIYNGEVVGTVTVHIVIPDSISFDSTSIVVPYGKTVELSITALYGVNEVTLKDGDINFTLDNSEIGEIEGTSFTAVDNEIENNSSTIIATVAENSEVTATATITLGKGSDVIFDFENGSTNGFKLNYSNYNYYLPNSDVYVATSETGQVHSGNYSLALNIDYSNSLESGYQMIALYQSGTTAYYENAKTIGMWIYIPDEAVGLWARWMIYPITAIDDDGNYTLASSSITGQTVDGSINGTTGYVYSFEESGWHYLSIDVSSYKGAAIRSNYYLMQFYISDRDGSAFGYYFKNQSNVNGNFTFYIDDITVDYSDAVDDRDAPVFSSLTYATTSMSDAVSISKDDIPSVGSNTVSFAAKVSENTSSTNYSGLDTDSARAYVDGNEVNCSYSNGTIAMDAVTLADGVHTIKFTIEDKAGNYSSIIRQIDVEAESDISTIKIVAQDDSQDRILLGSLYYVDIVATDIENVSSVSVEIDLDSMSVWELDHMSVASGFTATYSIQEDENIATISILRTGSNNATGEAVLVSMPIRTWELSDPVTTSAGKTWDYAAFYASKEFWPIAVMLEIDRGTVVFTYDSVGYFSGDSIKVDTEMWANYSNMVSTTEGTEYYNSWNGGHTHDAASLNDVSATCTEDGYTGRTFCEECNSIVDWGTTIPATGHSYDFVDEVLQCTTCGALYTGEYDGKMYENGLLVSDGWSEDGNYYYVNGVAVTGIFEIEGVYYEFDDSGTCSGTYTGLFYVEDTLYYAVAGYLKTGWIYEDGEYYYFDLSTYAAVDGVVSIDDRTYTFVDKSLYDGAWYNTENGIICYWAGQVLCNTWIEIKGNTYYFDSNCYAATGQSLIKLSTGGQSRWYVFDNEGVLLYAVEDTGLYEANGDTYYVIEGVVQTGIREVDGFYYYFNSAYKMISGQKKYVDSNAANGYVSEGYCWFGDDGAMLNKVFADPEGTGTDVYYIMGRPSENSGWVISDGATYYVTSNGTKIKSDRWIDGVYYYFDSDDGHLCDYEFIYRNEVKYYCVGGVIQKTGLTEIDGYTYYLSTNSGRVISDCGYWIEVDSESEAQLYYFDEDGKMRDEEFFTIDGVIYYMIGGQPAKLGLFEVGDDLYYASTNSGAIKTGKYYVESKNANGLTGDCYYYFDEYGKAISGFYTDSSTTYYLVNGLPSKDGLMYIDGYYYYFSTNSGAMKTGPYYIEEKNANGLLPEGWYTFSSDGKMVVE